MTIRDSVLVVHGPVGCSSATNGYRELYQNVPRELGRPDFELNVLSSNLTEKDIVFGGESKLRQAILEAVKRYSPKAIIIVTSCASGVMGDDIEGVVDSLRFEVDAVLVPINCGAFKSEVLDVCETAFDAAAHAIVKHLVAKPKRKQPDLVNIIAPPSVSWADRVEIDRLFSKIRLRPIFIPDFATTEELQSISEAAVTAPSCPLYGDYLQQSLYEQYGVPFFREPAPWGIESTKDWLRNIGKYTDRENEVEELIKEELAIVLPQLDQLKEQFKGKNTSIVIAAGPAKATFMSYLAAELGIKVSAVNIPELDPQVEEELAKVRAIGGAFEVYESDFQPFKQSHLHNRLKPDGYSGCPFLGLNKRGVSNVRNRSFRSDYSHHANKLAFRGAINYGYLIQRALTNSSLAKTLNDKTFDVYKEWWYQQSDLSYSKSKDSGLDK